MGNFNEAVKAMKQREPSCDLNHDALRRELRDKQLPPHECPGCGWVLHAAKPKPEPERCPACGHEYED